jgi:drug/metabolite transporter (DMT)-like permease
MRQPFQAAESARALGLLGAAQLAIGAAAIFARFALTAGGPLWDSALRLGLATLPIAVIAFARGAYRRLAPAVERRLALAGIALAAHFGLWLTSLRFAGVATSTLLVCTTPIVAEAWTIVRTRTWRPLAAGGIALAAIGVAVIAGAPDPRDTPLGIGLALGGAVAFAAYLLLVRGVGAGAGTLAVVARTYPAGALILAAAALLTHDAFPPAGAPVAWGGILAMAFVSQLFGHTALNAVLRTLGATLVGMSLLLEPVIAAGAAAIIFGERLAPLWGVGAVIILAGIGLAIRAERGSGVY